MTSAVRASAMPGLSRLSVKNAPEFRLIRRSAPGGCAAAVVAVCALAQCSLVARRVLERSPMRRRLIAHFAFGVLVLMAAARVASAQTTVAANYDLLLHELSENSSLGAHGDVATPLGPIDVLGEVG